MTLTRSVVVLPTVCFQNHPPLDDEVDSSDSCDCDLRSHLDSDEVEPQPYQRFQAALRIGPRKIDEPARGSRKSRPDPRACRGCKHPLVPCRLEMQRRRTPRHSRRMRAEARHRSERFRYHTSWGEVGDAAAPLRMMTSTTETHPHVHLFRQSRAFHTSRARKAPPHVKAPPCAAAETTSGAASTDAKTPAAPERYVRPCTRRPAANASSRTPEVGCRARPPPKCPRTEPTSIIVSSWMHVTIALARRSAIRGITFLKPRLCSPGPTRSAPGCMRIARTQDVQRPNGHASGRHSCIRRKARSPRTRRRMPRGLVPRGIRRFRSSAELSALQELGDEGGDGRALERVRVTCPKSSLPLQRLDDTGDPIVPADAEVVPLTDVVGEDDPRVLSHAAQHGEQHVPLDGTGPHRRSRRRRAESVHGCA